jgi:uncharacterized small protein (DUF1192 family)
MEQYVIKMAANLFAAPKPIFGGYYYSPSAHIFEGAAEAKKALTYIKKDISESIKIFTKEVARLEKEVAKSKDSFYKVSLMKAKEGLNRNKGYKPKAVKL